jgi:hypothetical protein
MAQESLPIGSCVMGEIFNAAHANNKFYKVLPESMVSDKNYFKYKPGLNAVTVFKAEGECYGYGLYFADYMNIHNFLHYGGLIAIVTVPDDAFVYTEMGKFKANKIILTNIVPIGESKLWSDPEFCSRAVSMHPLMGVYSPEHQHSIKYCKKMADLLPSAIRHMDNQLPEICTVAIKRDPFSIQHVRDQTSELCKLAIEINPFSIRCIDNQTPELCMLAINSNPSSICCISDQTPELCRLAISKEPRSIQYIKDKTDDLYKFAIETKEGNQPSVELIGDPIPESMQPTETSSQACSIS